MKKDDIEILFKNLEGSFNDEEPQYGHQNRFLEKLRSTNDTSIATVEKPSWNKLFSIAASIIILAVLSFGLLNQTPSIEEQVAKVSPEISNSQFYFASLIEEQIKELNAENSPETQKIILDTTAQLKKLEANYESLKKDLVAGGNSKLLLSAMITNFQTRIDLLNDVLEQMEDIKNLKNYNDANYTL